MKALVASHERAGTHFLINSIGLNFNYDMSPLQHEMPCMELPNCTPCMVPHHGRGSAESLWRYNMARFKTHIANCIEAESKIEGEDHIYKTHLDFDFLTSAQCSLNQVLKDHFNIFYITRDPKDTLLSLYLYLGAPAKEAERSKYRTLVPSSLQNEEGKDPSWQPSESSIKEFLFETPPDLYTHGSTHSVIFNDTQKFENFIERWYVHNDKWTITTGVNIFTYENLTNSFEEQMERVSRIVNRPMPAKLIKPTLEHPSLHPRKGIVGDHKNFFSDEIDEEFDKYLLKYEQKFGALQY